MERLGSLQRKLRDGRRFIGYLYIIGRMFFEPQEYLVGIACIRGEQKAVYGKVQDENIVENEPGFIADEAIVSRTDRYLRRCSW